MLRVSVAWGASHDSRQCTSTASDYTSCLAICSICPTKHESCQLFELACPQSSLKSNLKYNNEDDYTLTSPLHKSRTAVDTVHRTTYLVYRALLMEKTSQRHCTPPHHVSSSTDYQRTQFTQVGVVQICGERALSSSVLLNK